MKAKKRVAWFAALCLAIAMMVGLTAFAAPVSAETPDGWQFVDGEWYYYEGGELLKNGVYGIGTEQVVLYYFDADGVMANNEWIYVDEIWYYAQDGGALCVNGIYSIGGSLYAFDADGWMFEDENFWLWSETADGSEEHFYRAKANGALYVNEWYLDEDNDWWYYGDNGVAASGYTVVDGVPYAFDFAGRMIKGPCIAQIEENSYVYVDGNDHATAINANGWTKVGNEWLYGKDGELYEEGVYEIDGDYYYFSNYFMMHSDSFGVWNDSVWTVVRAKSDGRLYVNEWYQDTWNAWYYYGEDGNAVSGLAAINGAWYYFDGQGEAYRNRTRTIDGWFYVFGDDCAARYTQNGWILDHNNNWVYVDNGTVLEDGLYEIDGVTYAFESGNLIGIKTTIEYNGDYYLIGDDGVVIATPGWQSTGYGYVWVNEGGTLATGWQIINGAWYYLTPYMNHSDLVLEIEYNNDGVNPRLYAFNTNGNYTEVTTDGMYTLDDGETVLVEGGKVVTETWKLINGAWYYFNGYGWALTGLDMVGENWYYFKNDGRMIEGGWYLPYPGEWLYAKAGGALLTGKQTIGDVTYYFTSDGILYSNVTMVIDGNLVVIGDGGAVLYDQPAVDGWHHVNGAWYYTHSGGYLVTGDQAIDGKYYYFDYSTRRMVVNVERNSRYYGADGWALTGGWYLLADGWIYAQDNGYLADGYRYIDNMPYLFDDSRLVVNQTVVYGDWIYTTNASGVVISETYLSEDIPDGWSYQTYHEYGYVFYYVNGMPYTGWVGDYYISNGTMVYDDIIELDGKLYYLDESGLLVRNRWITEAWQIGPDSYAYEYALAKADGSLHRNEWYAYGGVWYYFDGAWTLCDGVYTIGGTEHVFDENSVWLGAYQAQANTMSGYADGWNYIDGEWYYYMAGNPVWGSIYDGGRWYYLNEAMVTNAFAEQGYGAIFYYDASGARAAYTGWQRIDGEWVYFNADHSVATGWIMVDGANYYIEIEYEWSDANGYTLEIGMKTGYEFFDGDLYYFNASGACTGKVVADGWYLAGSDWYYFENGRAVYDEFRVINGNEYYFDYDGTMAANEVIWGGYYYGADGALLRNGWALTEDGWVYANEDGDLLRGIHNIGGTVYVFDDCYLID